MIRERYLERVCLHRRPEVLGVYADSQLVNLEVVRAADDCAVRLFFACEVSWAQVSIYTGREDGQRTHFARPSFQASIGVTMFEGWALLVGCSVLRVGCRELDVRYQVLGVGWSVVNGAVCQQWWTGVFVRVAHDSFVAGRSTSSSVDTDANDSDCCRTLPCRHKINFIVGDPVRSGWPGRQS